MHEKAATSTADAKIFLAAVEEKKTDEPAGCLALRLRRRRRRRWLGE